MQAEQADAWGSKPPVLPTRAAVGNSRLSSVSVRAARGNPALMIAPTTSRALGPWPREGAGAQYGRAHLKPCYCPAFCFS